MAARKEKDPSPGEQVAALARALAAPPLPRIVVLRGDERWYREEALRHVLDAAKRAGFDVEKYDTADPDFDLRSFADALRAPPMFAAARCVVARNATALLKKEGGSDSSVTRAVLAFVKDDSVGGMIVLDADGLRADHAVSKAALAARGHVLGLRRLYDSPPPWDPDPRKTEIVAWVNARARERKVTLTLDEALYVAVATGNDLFALDAALERLSKRGGATVKSLVPWQSGGSPFDLAEHMCRGDVAKSVAGIEALFRLGFADKTGEREIDRNALLAITLGALRGKLRACVAAARVLERGGTIDAAAAAADVPGYPKAREEFALRMRARDRSRWRVMLAGFAELERKPRRGGQTDANDLCALALRWRARTAARKAASPN
jgi:DNA polymerase III delta subunit